MSSACILGDWSCSLLVCSVRAWAASVHIVSRIWEGLQDSFRDCPVVKDSPPPALCCAVPCLPSPLFVLDQPERGRRGEQGGGVTHVRQQSRRKKPMSCMCQSGTESRWWGQPRKTRAKQLLSTFYSWTSLKVPFPAAGCQTCAARREGGCMKRTSGRPPEGWRRVKCVSLRNPSNLHQLGGLLFTLWVGPCGASGWWEQNVESWQASALWRWLPLKRREEAVRGSVVG